MGGSLGLRPYERVLLKDFRFVESFVLFLFFDFNFFERGERFVILESHFLGYSIINIRIKIFNVMDWNSLAPGKCVGWKGAF